MKSKLNKLAAISIVVLVLIVTGIVTATRSDSSSKYTTEKLKRASIIETVEASGTINPVKTVNIGSQVSGMVSQIYVDYNSKVKKGELLAQIDPSLFQAQVDQARGTLAAAQANYQKTKSMLIYDKQNYERYRKLYKKNYVSKSDLDLAEATYKSDVAQLNAMSAQINQTQGALRNNLTNLKYTKIISPVDGVVVSRNVDVGQTVAASFQTPTLFMVAQDLTKMQIEVSVSEADIGRIKEGQEVDYTLDGYSDKVFKGRVSQVRISPTTVSNVVTYTVIVVVDNDDQILKPGMTANVSILTDKKDNVLCVSSEALRFVPKSSKKGAQTTEEKTKKYKEQGIWTLQNGHPVRVTIKTGAKDSDKVEIISAELKEGDTIIIGNADKNSKTSQMKPPMRMF